MASFNARLYGWQENGIEVRAWFELGQLKIQAAQQVILSVASTQLNPTAGGFNHTQLFLHWTSADRSLSLTPILKEDQQLMLNNAPAQLLSRLGPWRKRRNGIRFVWSTLATLAILILAIAFFTWWQYDFVVSKIAGLISVEQEIRLGNQALKHIERDEKLIKTGAAVDTMQELVKRLVAKSNYQYRLIISNDKEVNAYALPGGIIIVNAGMLKLIEYPEELAALLAHEIQHVEQRHALKGAIGSVGWATALAVLLGDFSSVAILLTHEIGSLYISREIEQEADQLGLKMLITAKILPQYMASLFEKLNKGDNEISNAVPGWLSTHQQINERISAVNQFIKTSPCSDCRPLKVKLEKIKLELLRLNLAK